MYIGIFGICRLGGGTKVETPLLPWVKYEREKGKGGDNINFDMFHNAQLIDIRCYLCGPSQ